MIAVDVNGLALTIHHGPRILAITHSPWGGYDINVFTPDGQSHFCLEASDDSPEVAAVLKFLQAPKPAP